MSLQGGYFECFSVVNCNTIEANENGCKTRRHPGATTPVKMEFRDKIVLPGSLMFTLFNSFKARYVQMSCSIRIERSIDPAFEKHCPAVQQKRKSDYAARHFGCLDSSIANRHHWNYELFCIRNWFLVFLMEYFVPLRCTCFFFSSSTDTIRCDVRNQCDFVVVAEQQRKFCIIQPPAL